jgi:uncharacterized protein (TIGR03084 family)
VCAQGGALSVGVHAVPDACDDGSVEQICADLEAEHDVLDQLVGTADPDAWDRSTPAVGWAVRDQISHLGFFDRSAVLAATDPAAFAASVHELVSAGADVSVWPGRGMGPADLLMWWRAGRRELLAALRPLEPKARLPWYGPPMSARSFATARLMETWAHGQDVADALGVEREPSDRLRHIAHLGFQTRAFAYVNRGLDAPTEPMQVVLTLPSGTEWTAGDPLASNRVTGSALDFCLVVTQRRHRADTALEATGEKAEEWLAIAQAFAGPPGEGRPVTDRRRA